ncbi:MAG TPA: DNA-processing protein DprA [Myxococcota bacterium]|nr:DNA-processing protein DprA [Myxococcota bacterium]
MDRASPASGALDPSDPGCEGALRPWLAFQHALALEPTRAARALRSAGWDPLRALALSGAPPPSEADVAAAHATLLRVGARVLPLPAAGYPWRFALLREPPPVLAVRGDPSLLSRRAVAIVGARAATAYGRAVARRLAADLAASGLVVVSGLARGIDAAAHEGALEAGGATVAVLACGPEQVYPPEHRGLASRIAASGALVSELPPRTPPRPAHFPLRNRLISGLSEALVVVEARVKSGSLHTVRHALDQGIDVLAVPGPVDSPTSAGPNLLLRDGAAPALDASDVLAVLAGPARVAPSAEPALSPEQGALLASLRREPASRDGLSRRLGVSPQALAAPLLELELGGRVVLDPDGRWRALS